MSLIKCPKCGKEYDDNLGACPECNKNVVEEINGEPYSNTTIENITAKKEKKKFKLGYLVLILGIASLPLLCLCYLGVLVAIPTIIIALVLLIKKTKEKVPTIIGLICALLTIILATGVCTAQIGKNVKDAKTQSEIESLINTGQYDLAIEKIGKAHLSSTKEDEYMYSIYIGKGDYDNAANIYLKIFKDKEDKSSISDSEMSKISSIYDNLSDSYKEQYDELVLQRDEDIARKEEEERLAEEEKAKKEAEALAEKEAKEAEKQAKKEAKEAEKQAKKEAEKQAADEKEAEKQAKIDAANNAAAEKEAKENEAKEQAEKAEKDKIDNAKVLGSDIYMDTHKSEYNNQYYKVNGTIEKVEDEAYLVRYISTITNHKQLCWVWVNSKEASKRSVNEYVKVVGEYIGFAEGSSAPTIEEIKVETSENNYFDLVNKSKVVNEDVSYESLLRYGEHQEFLHIEATVTAVFEECINVQDVYGNKYVVYDYRVNQSVVLPGDNVTIFGTFEGIAKDGRVWPLIRWLYDDPAPAYE